MSTALAFRTQAYETQTVGGSLHSGGMNTERVTVTSDVTATVTHISSAPSAQAAAVSPRLRMTKRGRVVLTVLVAIPLAIGAIFMMSATDGAVATDTAVGASASTSFHYITIMQGQSLWQIAGEIAPNSDPRDVVAEISHLNNLQGEVQPGQQIAIPTKYSK